MSANINVVEYMPMAEIFPRSAAQGGEYGATIASGAVPFFHGRTWTSKGLVNTLILPALTTILRRVTGFNSGGAQFLWINRGSESEYRKFIGANTNFDFVFSDIECSGGVVVENSTSLTTFTAGAEDCYISIEVAYTCPLRILAVARNIGWRPSAFFSPADLSIFTLNGTEIATAIALTKTGQGNFASAQFECRTQAAGGGTALLASTSTSLDTTLFNANYFPFSTFASINTGQVYLRQLTATGSANAAADIYLLGLRRRDLRW